MSAAFQTLLLLLLLLLLLRWPFQHVQLGEHGHPHLAIPVALLHKCPHLRDKRLAFGICRASEVISELAGVDATLGKLEDEACGSTRGNPLTQPLLHNTLPTLRPHSRVAAPGRPSSHAAKWSLLLSSAMPRD